MSWTGKVQLALTLKPQQEKTPRPPPTLKLAERAAQRSGRNRKPVDIEPRGFGAGTSIVEHKKGWTFP